MLFSRILPFLSLVSAVLAWDVPGDDFDIVTRQTTKKAKCAKGVHIIAVRGNNGSDTGGDGYGITLPLLNAIKAAVPHSTNDSVSYPHTSQTFRDQNTIATKAETKLITQYISSCPNTPIVLYGYSEGAGITMNTVCGTSSLTFTKTPALSKKFVKNIISIIAYSDDTRVANQPYDLGNCTGAGPAPRTKPAACDPFAPVIKSYCNSEDAFCCKGGQNHVSHYSYFHTYDAAVAKFVAKQFKKYKAAQAA